MKMKWLGIAVVGVLVLLVAAGCVSRWMDARVQRELQDDPQGERARKTMMMTLPSGKVVTVNYLHEGDTVYAAADFPWWHELRDGGGRGSVFIRGETFDGHIRAVEDDPELRESVFARLRPTAPLWWGVLIVVDLDKEER